jgi:hypothetical protein
VIVFLLRGNLLHVHFDAREEVQFLFKLLLLNHEHISVVDRPSSGVAVLFLFALRGPFILHAHVVETILVTKVGALRVEREGHVESGNVFVKLCDAVTQAVFDVDVKHNRTHYDKVHLVSRISL